MDTNEFYSTEAEQAVLGALLIENGALERLGGLGADDFFRRDHRLIFDAIKHLAEEEAPFDVLTVAEHLERKGMLQDIGDLPYLTALHANTPSTANVGRYASIVRDRAQRRQISKILQELGGTLLSAESASDALAEAQSRLESVVHESAGRSVDWQTILKSAINAIDEAAERRKQGGTVGVPTGFPTLDARTGGFYGQRLWVVAARPSIGKSAITLQMALHAASLGYKVGIVSLEMPAEEIGQRALANRLGINLTKLSQGFDDELSAVVKGLQKLSGLNLFVDDDTYSLSGIISRITEWRRNERIDFAVVDHVGLVEGDDSATRVDHLSKVTRALKKLTKRLDMPVVAVSQLNRSVEKEKRLPKLSDLRDSGSIEQDCDIAMFLHCDEADEEAPEKKMNIGLLKNRGGVRGWLPNLFVFEGRTQRFREGR